MTTHQIETKPSDSDGAGEIDDSGLVFNFHDPELH